uniref:DHHA2 domain-containing protein n=2 Tax=Alexandrium monilatum TaxID=311494 RepID=A0A7S4W385_9DINO
MGDLSQRRRSQSSTRTIRTSFQKASRRRRSTRSWTTTSSDHHKLSGLTNSEPLEVDMRSLCSATSILYSRATTAGLKITKPIAGLMLAGILSDSLGFKSPTTTEMDKKHAEELAVLAGLNMTAFFEGMVAAKAKVDQMSPMHLLKLDSKVYTIGGEKLRVSVVETPRPEDVLKKKVSLVHAMKKMVEDEKLDDVLFFVIDIKHETALFLPGSNSASAMVEKAFHTWVHEDSGVALIPGVLSRKKQIIPALEAAVVTKSEVTEL